MANKNIEITNPGYVGLWTDDMPIQANTLRGESGNLLDGNNANAIVEGEWLVHSANGKYLEREVITTQTAIAYSNLGVKPSVMYFYEQGNPVPLTIGLGHTVIGPVGMVLKVKFGDFGATTVAPGARLFVCDITHDGGVKRGLATSAALTSSAGGTGSIDSLTEDPATATANTFSPCYLKRWINQTTAEVVYSPALVGTLSTLN